MRIFNLILSIKLFDLLLIFAPVSTVSAQYYSLKIYKETKSLEGESLNGYQTQFLQPAGQVKKAWWKYIKSKAVISNHLSHYELKFPAGRFEKDTYALSVFEGNDTIDVSKLFVALKTDSLSSSDIDVLDSEIKSMLMDFKISFFTSILQKQIKDQEKKASQMSGQIEKLRKSKNKDNLSAEQIKAKEDGYLYSLNQIENNLDSLKIQLRKIK